MRKATITLNIQTRRTGFYYKIPELGISGFEPTIEKLAVVFGETLQHYMEAPNENRDTNNPTPGAALSDRG